jgi:hypothetical protein
MSRRPSLLIGLIATVALIAPAAPLALASGAAPADNQPAAKAKAAEPLISVDGMSASYYAACVTELASRKIVFEPVGDARDQGCALSLAASYGCYPARSCRSANSRFPPF